MDGPGFETHQWQKKYIFSKTVQIGPGANLTSYEMVTGVPCRGVKWPGRDIDHSPPVLRMSGAIPLFSLYAFVAWTRTISRFTFVISVYIGLRILL